MIKFYGWNTDLSAIPNQAHFKVEVKLKTGELVKTKVRRNNETHFHSLIGVRIGSVAYWRPR